MGKSIITQNHAVHHQGVYNENESGCHSQHCESTAMYEGGIVIYVQSA